MNHVEKVCSTNASPALLAGHHQSVSSEYVAVRSLVEVPTRDSQLIVRLAPTAVRYLGWMQAVEPLPLALLLVPALDPSYYHLFDVVPSDLLFVPIWHVASGVDRFLPAHAAERATDPRRAGPILRLRSPLSESPWRRRRRLSLAC